jgi:hypothetical protein
VTDPSDPWARPAQQPPQSYQPQPGHPAGPTYAAPPPPPQGYSPQGPAPAGPSGADTEPTEPSAGRFKRLVRDPLSIVLVVVIVLALGAAGLIGGEIYARHRGDAVVAATLKCVLQDDVTVSFGAFPPFLWQYATDHYRNVTVTSAGNQIRDMKGMKVEVAISDARPATDGSSQGTLGSLNVTSTWSTDGIKATVQNAIPLLGGLVSGVTTNGADGTVNIQGPLGSIVAKPQIVDNELSLQVQQLTGLGFTLPREAVQPALDAVSSQLTKNSPLALQADSVQVTDTGVITKLSAQNATIPGGQEQPCNTGI